MMDDNISRQRQNQSITRQTEALHRLDEREDRCNTEALFAGYGFGKADIRNIIAAEKEDPAAIRRLHKRGYSWEEIEKMTGVPSDVARMRAAE